MEVDCHGQGETNLDGDGDHGEIEAENRDAHGNRKGVRHQAWEIGA